MIMYFVSAVDTRNALGDSFVGMVSKIRNRGDSYIILPNTLYTSDEIGEGFYRTGAADFHVKGRVRSLIRALGFYRHMHREIRKHGVDKLLIFSESDWSYFLLRITGSLRRVKTSVYIHDPRHHSGEQLLIRLGRKLFFSLVVRKSENIFVSYGRAVSELTSEWPYLSKSNVICAPLPGVLMLENERLRNEVRAKRLGIEFDLVFFGRLEPYKGVELLIDAVEEINGREHESISLCIVGGRGSLKEKVCQRVSNNKNIKMIDSYLGYDELCSIIARSRIVVLPYTDATGTQTVQTASYFYKPVIAADVGCFGEYIEDGVNGILFRAGDKEALVGSICRLLDNKDMLEVMADKMEGYYEKRFAIQQFTDGIEGILREK